ncbi:hypothetical protein AnigIFM62618_009672 [Aspergillus niger]|nr:hypothetical protein AnigIFM62618_009672 [Aspergillus niger]
MPIPFSFAAPCYDRMVPLATGEVRPAGLDLNFVELQHPRDVFDRMVRNGEFDASELSSSEYITRHVAGDRTFTAVPAFPLRTFRHGYIVVNTDRIKSPADLSGKRIGVQLYTMTAAVWIRGLLMHEYGVDLSSITWIEGRMDAPGAHGKPSVLIRREGGKPLASIEKNNSGKSLNQLLVDGEIDATIGAEVPSCLWDNEKAPHIQRLFPNYKEAEKEYYRKTGIFPIMHLVAIRREVYDQHKWIATSLFQALNESKELVRKRTYMPGMIRCMLPWLREALEETVEVFGEDCWPYGIEKNRKTLEALVQYLYEQGMIERVVRVDELFAPVQEAPFVIH